MSHLVARTTSTTPGGIVVAVQDCGPRIDETSLARLFHPFFTTKAGRGVIALFPTSMPPVAHVERLPPSPLG